MAAPGRAWKSIASRATRKLCFLPLSVPSDHCVRLDDSERLPSSRPELEERDPKCAIECR